MIIRNSVNTLICSDCTEKGELGDNFRIVVEKTSIHIFCAICEDGIVLEDAPLQQHIKGESESTQ